MSHFRACTLLEELDIEGSLVEHRRGELYRMAAKRIRELESSLASETRATSQGFTAEQVLKMVRDDINGCGEVLTYTMDHIDTILNTAPQGSSPKSGLEASETKGGVSTPAVAVPSCAVSAVEFGCGCPETTGGPFGSPGPMCIRPSSPPSGCRKLAQEEALMRRTPSPVAVTAEELARLREIEHLAWHIMDDSELDMTTNEVTIRPMREDYDKLSRLLPEGHPGNDEEPSAAPTERDTNG